MSSRMVHDETLTGVEHTRGEVLPRGENAADAPPAVRVRVEAVPQARWTLYSSVMDILVARPMLNDFLRHNVCGRGVVDSNNGVTMEAFIIRPTMYIEDEELRKHITTLPAYEESKEDVRLGNTLWVTANNLEMSGVYSLRQWGAFTGKGKIDLLAREILDTALDAAKREVLVPHGTTYVVIDGVYESVYNAILHYVEGVGGDGRGFGMQVKEGEPPTAWPENEVMRGSVGEEDDDETPVDGRLELIVLTSKNGWPCTVFGTKKSSDVYVNKEVLRAWHKILNRLDECFSNTAHADKEFTPYVLIGTPGIGKSLAAGSFLLHQLLHYDTERLSVIAYFIRGDAYLFGENSDGGRVTWYEGDVAVRVIRDHSGDKRGFIIYDADGERTGPPLSLPPPGWGMVVISSPNGSQYEEWKTQKGAEWIVMNCPSLRDIKAMCAWEKANDRCNECEDYWRKIKERVDRVGPLPRYIFGDGDYQQRCTRVELELSFIRESNVFLYKNILRGDGEWSKASSSHKLVRMYRVVIDDCDVPMNAALTNTLYKETFAEVMKFLRHPVLNPPFIDRGRLNVEAYEGDGVNAFTDKRFVTALGEVLRIVQPPGGREGQESVFKQRGLVAYASGGYCSFTTDTSDGRRRIEYSKLYRPSAPNFPLVNGFYLVKSTEGRVTLIGVRTTAAGSHDTTATAVGNFKKYLEECFSDWANISERVSWEIIHMQPQVDNEGRQTREWQGCTLNASREYTVEEQNTIIAFWNERVNQYQVNMSPTMVLHFTLALEAMDSRIMRFIRENGRS